MSTEDPLKPSQREWSTVCLPSPDIVSRDIAGERLLIPVKGNLADLQRIFSLNAVGAFIWDRFDGRTLGEIRDEVLETFDIGPEEAERDVLAFVRGLKESGLLSEDR